MTRTGYRAVTCLPTTMRGMANYTLTALEWYASQFRFNDLLAAILVTDGLPGCDKSFVPLRSTGMLSFRSMRCLTTGRQFSKRCVYQQTVVNRSTYSVLSPDRI